MRQFVPHVSNQLSRSAQYTDGLSNPVAGPVAMRVHAAAAGADHRALPAGRTEFGDPLLPGRDAWMREHRIQGVREHVKPGGWGTVVGDLERVRLLVCPSVSMTTIWTGASPRASVLLSAPASVAMIESNVLIRDRVSVSLPTVEDGNQPVRVVGSPVAAARVGGLS